MEIRLTVNVHVILALYMKFLFKFYKSKYFILLKHRNNIKLFWFLM